jgi:hypothetical protein
MLLQAEDNKKVKTTSVYTESTELTLQAIKKHIHLVTQSRRFNHKLDRFLDNFFYERIVLRRACLPCGAWQV